jgi:uncharacterized protein involved in type VI secretion and phage assembly
MRELASRKFFGKYRGTVEDNADPDGRGRLKLSVPDVLGARTSTWAEACVPLAGPPMMPMGVHFVPPRGSAVWVEFERGAWDRPIWVGCIWSGKDSSGVPSAARDGRSTSPSIVMQTLGRNCLIISDAQGASGGITLRSASGAMISIGDNNIMIRSAEGVSIELTAGNVRINGDALEVQ